MPAADITWAVKTWAERCQGYKNYADYYDGKHPLLFATEKFRNVFGPLFQEFADNLCPTVVDSVADRLRVESWDGKDAVAASELWDAQDMDRVMAEVFTKAGTYGDSFVICWPNKDKDPVYWAHDPDQVCVEYDDEDDPGLIVKGAKNWITKDERARINLYYDGKIEKWVTRNKVKAGALPDKEDEWVPTNDGKNVIKHEYGMPIFHFGNGAAPGQFGVSDLRDVIPLQDTLNKSVCDMLVAMEFVAYPQRYATGLQVEMDSDTGKPIRAPFTPGVDRVWAAAGDVKFGEFSSADLANFLNVQNNVRAEIARVSGTPPHELNLETTWPTGEALRVSEGRTIKKTIKRQTSYRGVIAAATAFGLTVSGKTSDKKNLRPVWANPNPHNPLLDAETALVKIQAGVSKTQALIELGYDEKKVKEMLAEAEAAAEKAAEQMAAGGLTGQPHDKPTAFNRNGPPGQASRPAPRQQSTRRPVDRAAK